MMLFAIVVMQRSKGKVALNSNGLASLWLTKHDQHHKRKDPA